MATDWTALLIAFVGGSLMATAISAFVRYLVVHPVISVRLDEDRGSNAPVIDAYRVDGQGNPVIDGQGNPAKHKARYLRLYVENTGHSSIKDCSGYITKITKRVAGTQSHSKQEVIDLGWTHQRAGNANQRDIPRGAFFHLDVVSVHQWPGPGWKLELPQGIPNTLLEFLTGKAKYEFEILIAADNARPRRVLVKFDYDPEKDELRFVPVNKARYPWWAWWRWLRSRWQE
jgi:hypothetical protein